MKRWLIAVVLLLVGGPVFAQTLDQFYGDANVNCPNGPQPAGCVINQATGTACMTYIATVSGRKIFCDPLGHPLVIHAVDEANFAICHVDPAGQGCTANAGVNHFVPSNNSEPGGAWADATAQRFLSWGINALGAGNYAALVPWNNGYGGPTDPCGRTTIAHKMMIIPEMPGSYYPRLKGAASISQPVKGISAAVANTSAYLAYKEPPDVYDTNLYTYQQDQMTQENPCYAPYIVGFFSDDADYTFGLIDSMDPNHLGTYTGYNAGLRDGWIVALASPVQFEATDANGTTGTLYPNPEVYTKIQWQTYIEGQHASVSALNTAWGSSYTTFGTSGTCFGSAFPTGLCPTPSAAFNLGTGNGSTVTFTGTLTTTVSKHSLGVFVGSTLEAGDDGSGNIVSSNVTSSTINYSTGAISVTFATAPANGAAITVQYIANGWCIGTGLMDECYATASHAYMGTDSTGTVLTGASAGLLADVDAFSGDMAAEYLSGMRNAARAVQPNALFFGPDAFIGYGAMPYSWILQAAAGNVDAMEITEWCGPACASEPSGAGWLPANYFTWLQQYAGDMPVFMSFYTVAQNDSELYPTYSQTNLFSTQSGRGQYYAQTVANGAGAKFPDGLGFFLGTNEWQLYDDWSQHLNWGTPNTARDNSYDGREAGPAVTTCEVITSAYCGNDYEPTFYGDLTDYMKTANLQLYGKLFPTASSGGSVF